MRVLLAPRTGPPEVLRLDERETPEPGPGAVLVRMTAVAVTPAETRVRAGVAGPELKGVVFPWIPGRDVVGTVEDVGPGVASPAVGDRVIATVPDATGGCAEFVAVPAHLAAAAPDALGDDEAVSVAGPGVVAWRSLVGAARVKAGHHVLVTQATTPIGRAVVTLARVLGAHVVVVDRGDRVHALRRIGAHASYDQDVVPYAAVVDHVDVVVCQIPYAGALHEDHPLHQALTPLHRGGTLISLCSPPPEDAAQKGVRTPRLSADPDPEALRNVLALAARGDLRVPVAAALPLAEAARAHALVEADVGDGTVVLRAPRAGWGTPDG